MVRPRKAADRRSRPQRWNAAVAELLTLQADYAAWLEALPEALQGTPAAEALRAVVDLDLETLANIEPATRIRSGLTTRNGSDGRTALR